MPGVFHANERHNVVWVCDSVTVVFISLWKLVLFCIFVERNTMYRYIISYTNAYFIMYVNTFTAKNDILSFQ